MAINTDRLWHLPAILVLVIYLPASLFGAYIFHNVYAFSFLALLAIFAGSYYLLYPRFARVLVRASVRSHLWGLGTRINWRASAWIAVLVYIITLVVAALTTQATPLGAALRGASLMEIADARASFLAKREGLEALLRYSAVILGRSVMPFLVAYAYWSEHRLRHVALAVLLACYGISLEKAAPVFAFLPLIVMRMLQKRWKAATFHAAMLVACFVLWTFLATGGLHAPARVEMGGEQLTATSEEVVVPPRADAEQKPNEDGRRHYVFNLLNWVGLWPDRWERRVDDRVWWMVNRAIWVPYITAYDWLKFQDDGLGGGITLGRSIGVVAWLSGQPRVQLEQMVYAYQFGQSPGGAGASNTVFFVDAKLAFGWIGAIVYCLIFPLFAAAVFSSENDVAKAASATSFFTATLSPLTATLLSGGLAFYVAISLLARLKLDAAPAERSAAGAHEPRSFPAS
jgi:hypothetical protein